MGPIETSDSDAKHALAHAQNDWSCLGHIETCYSGPEVAVLYAKTSDEVWDPYRLVSLVLNTLICMHKTAGEVWYTQRLWILVQKSLFCMQKPQMSDGTHRD